MASLAQKVHDAGGGALYDSQATRDFVGIDLSRQSVPDATTLLKFQRMLQDNARPHGGLVLLQLGERPGSIQSCWPGGGREGWCSR